MLNSIFGFRNTFWSYSWWYLNMDWKWWYTSTVASCQVFLKPKMGLSENVVYPIFPMVLLIIIPTKWLFHWGYTPFWDIPKNRIQQAQKKYPRHRRNPWTRNHQAHDHRPVVDDVVYALIQDLQKVRKRPDVKNLWGFNGADQKNVVI